MVASEAHTTPEIDRKKCVFINVLVTANNGARIQNWVLKRNKVKKNMENMQKPTPSENIINGESVLLM